MGHEMQTRDIYAREPGVSSAERVYIKNARELSRTPERALALSLIEVGLGAIATEKIIDQSVKIDKEHLIFVESGSERNVSLLKKDIQNIYVIAIGKCALDASHALEKKFGVAITEGIACDVRKDTIGLTRIQAFEGSHPFPTAPNVEFTNRVLTLLEKTTENDLVVFVISGGGSTLLCNPTNNTCEDEKQVVEYLFKAGATISELNTVRKHLSRARGGHLAKAAYPATVVSLIFSDVVGNNLEFVASGPTVRDLTTVKDARVVLEKYNLTQECALIVQNLIETPKEEKYFEHTHNVLAASNEIALSAMKARGMECGYETEVCTSCLSGEARLISESIVERLHTTPPKTILLMGGETTVSVKGSGIGGRNQEIALSALLHIDDNEIVVACASDGIDNTPYAGAIADHLSKKELHASGMDANKALNENNSHIVWKNIGSYIDTGYTGINVADFLIAIKH